MIKTLNSMLLEGKKIALLIPDDVFDSHYSGIRGLRGISRVDEIDSTFDGAVILDVDYDGRVPALKLRRSLGRKYAVGIGCRRGASSDEIQAAFEDALEKIGIRREEVSVLASFEKKADEKGLLDFAKKMDLELLFYSADELNAVKTPNTTPRALKEFGVASVAEAAALKAADTTELALEKQKYGTVTMAVAATTV